MGDLFINLFFPAVTLIAAWALFDTRPPFWLRAYIIIHGAVFYFFMAAITQNAQTLGISELTVWIYSLTMALAAGAVSWRIFTWLTAPKIGAKT